MYWQLWLLVFDITPHDRFDGTACSNGDGHFRYKFELHRRVLPSQVHGKREYFVFYVVNIRVVCRRHEMRCRNIKERVPLPKSKSAVALRQSLSTVKVSSAMLAPGPKLQELELT